LVQARKNAQAKEIETARSNHALKSLTERQIKAGIHLCSPPEIQRIKPFTCETPSFAEQSSEEVIFNLTSS
jgi:hypothetical protein